MPAQRVKLCGAGPHPQPAAAPSPRSGLYCTQWHRPEMMLHGGASSSTNATVRASNVPATSAWRFAINASLIQELAESQQLSRQQHANYARLFRQQNQPESRLNIAVVGGSVTAGQGCKEGSTKGKLCAYPARFESWLQTKKVNASIHVHNLAVGGSTCASTLPQLGLLVTNMDDTDASKEDLIIIDFSVNDHAEIWANHLTLLQLEAVMEAQLDYMSSQHPALPILIFEACCFCNRYGASSVKERAASRWGVPFLLYDAPVLNNGCNRKTWPPAPGNNLYTHPSAKGHTQLAALLSAWWGTFERWIAQQHSHSSFTVVPFPPPTAIVAAEADKYRVCKAVTQYDASKYLFSRHEGRSGLQQYDSQRTILATGWTLFEDRPGKAGWISSEVGAVLEFNLTFGRHPSVSVVYERSYQSFGSAFATLFAQGSYANGFTEAVVNLTMDGILQKSSSWDAVNITQAHYDDTFASLVQFAKVKPHSAGLLRLTRPAALATMNSSAHIGLTSAHPGKFKVRYVSSC